MHTLMVVGIDVII